MSTRTLYEYFWVSIDDGHGHGFPLLDGRLVVRDPGDYRGRHRRSRTFLPLGQWELVSVGGGRWYRSGDLARFRAETGIHERMVRPR